MSKVLRFKNVNFCFNTIFFFCLILSNFLVAKADSYPNVFMVDASTLRATRSKAISGDGAFRYSIERLKREAARARSIEQSRYFSVVKKSSVPNGISKHNFFSDISNRYSNQDIYEIGQFVDTVETLAYGFYFLRDERFAASAIRLVNIFFLKSGTKMYPNLTYSRYNSSNGRLEPFGVIYFAEFPRIVDALSILKSSRFYDSDFSNGINKWFRELVNWMLNSNLGREMRNLQNNIGTNYDYQVASYAAFIGRTDIAVSILNQSKGRRIQTQILGDGRQPLELERTRSFDYSVENTKYLARLATVGANLGVNLWNYTAPNGGSIEKAINYLIPYALRTKSWQYSQASLLSANRLVHTLRMTAPESNYSYAKSILYSRFPTPLSDRSRLEYGLVK
jgi:Alginate lyase